MKQYQAHYTLQCQSSNAAQYIIIWWKFICKWLVIFVSLHTSKALKNFHASAYPIKNYMLSWNITCYLYETANKKWE
jgi:hypothetical protein